MPAGVGRNPPRDQLPGLAREPANAAPKPPPVSTRVDRAPHVQKSPLPAKDRPPLSAEKDALKSSPEQPKKSAEHKRPSMKSAAKAQKNAPKATAKAAAACSPSDFTSRSGSALVQQVKASTTDCINSLFSLTGGDAYYAFRESQMVSIAHTLRDNAVYYPGDNSTSTAQLVLYLRAGYYVQWYNSSTVGTYGQSLKTAIQSGLDAYFGNSNSSTVSDANGEVLAEAVTLIDSAQENARYIYVVKRLLNGYNSSYDASWWMLNAVNNVYTVLFRGHQVPAFVSAVQSDPSVLDTLNSFAAGHLSLLGTDRSYLASNAGREMARFLQHATLQAKVRPLASGLLGQSSMTGTTAPLWVGIAEMTDSYDKANCSYYGTCNLAQRLAQNVLTINHTCSSSIKIRAQDMTAGQLSDTCASLINQDAYFHSLVKDGNTPSPATTTPPSRSASSTPAPTTRPTPAPCSASTPTTAECTWKETPPPPETSPASSPTKPNGCARRSRSGTSTTSTPTTSTVASTCTATSTPTSPRRPSGGSKGSPSTSPTPTGR